MSIKYETEIGKYDEDVYVSIDLRIKDGLTKYDYEILRTAMQIIEDLAYQYKDRPSISKEPLA